jgi:hypothetical protein
MVQKILPTTPAFDAALAAMNNAKATANTVVTQSFSDSGHGKTSADQSEEVNNTSSSGGGNSGNNDVSAGNGGDGSDGDSSKGQFMKKSTVLAIALIISALSTLYFSLWKTTDKGIAADKDYNAIKLLQAQAEVLKASAASGVMPPGFEPVRSQQQVQSQAAAVVPAKQKEVVVVTTFGDSGPGSTSEEVEQLFASNPVWNIDASHQSLRIGQGHASIKLINVTSFEGHNFAVSVPEKDVIPNGRPDYFFKCGDVPQLTNDERKGDCLWFMKLYEKLGVRVAVFDGGYIKAD